MQENSHSYKMILTKLWTMWGAMLASYLFFGYVLYVRGDYEPVAYWWNDLFFKKLSGVAFITLVIAQYVPKFFFIVVIRSKTEPSRERIMASALVSSIIAWALTESVAIYGLILSLRFEVSTPFLIFAGIGLINMYLKKPDPEKWFAMVFEARRKLSQRNRS